MLRRLLSILSCLLVISCDSGSHDPMVEGAADDERELRAFFGRSRTLDEVIDRWGEPTGDFKSELGHVRIFELPSARGRAAREGTVIGFLVTCDPENKVIDWKSSFVGQSYLDAK